MSTIFYKRLTIIWPHFRRIVLQWDYYQRNQMGRMFQTGCEGHSEFKLKQKQYFRMAGAADPPFSYPGCYDKIGG